jgi:glucose/arabinose dehydrogenase
VLASTPEGKDQRFYATGLRNCVGMAVQPGTGELWCSVNERDGLGDDLVPDFVTRLREGAFYGWPWFYIGPPGGSRRTSVAAVENIVSILDGKRSATTSSTRRCWTKRPPPSSNIIHELDRILVPRLSG